MILEAVPVAFPGPPVRQTITNWTSRDYAEALGDRGREVEVEHLHIHLPRVLKTPADPRTANTEQEGRTAR